MKKEIFTKITLPHSHLEATIFEGTGFDLFKAQLHSAGDSLRAIIMLTCMLVEINGKLITEDELLVMHISDVNLIIEAIGTMMGGNVIKA